MSLAFGAIAEAKPKDRNRNGIPDRWERKYKLSTKRDLSRRDSDRDGINNRSEYRSATNPRKVDTDADGLEDADEDRDGDQVDNGNEQRQRTRQNDRDSDNDRRSDGREDRDADGLNNAGEDSSANDPIDDDSDDDGTEDGDENSGVVNSFDGTNLVIDRDIGGTVAGTVDGSTRVTCEDEDGHEDLQGPLAARLRSGSDVESEDAKGQVTSISSNSFTVELREGGSRTIQINGSTQFNAPDRDSSGAVDLDDLRVGDRVEVEFASGDLASQVQVEDPAEEEDGEEIKGVITGISGSEITVEGRFGQTWAVQVDGSTFFVAPDRDSSGGVTLDDLRVGDRVEAELAAGSNLALSVEVEDIGDPNDEDGYEDGEDGDAEENDGSACPVDLLIPGARVHEAELSGSGVFIEIEIVSPDAGDNDVEESVGQVTAESGNSVTILRASTGAEVTASLRSDTRIRCKSIYGGKPVACDRSEIVPGVLLHEFEIEGGSIDKLVLLK